MHGLNSKNCGENWRKYVHTYKVPEYRPVYNDAEIKKLIFGKMNSCKLENLKLLFLQSKLQKKSFIDHLQTILQWMTKFTLAWAKLQKQQQNLKKTCPHVDENASNAILFIQLSMKHKEIVILSKIAPRIFCNCGVREGFLHTWFWIVVSFYKLVISACDGSSLTFH